MTALELGMQRGADGIELLAPEAGHFTCALPRGAALSAGQSAGVLTVLGRSHALLVPASVTGRIAEERPERVHEPVEVGQVEIVHGGDRGFVECEHGLEIVASHDPHVMIAQSCRTCLLGCSPRVGTKRLLV